MIWKLSPPRSRKFLSPRRKLAKFGGEGYKLLKMIFTVVSDLGGLCVPSTSLSGHALREIFRDWLRLRRPGSFVVKHLLILRDDEGKTVSLGVRDRERPAADSQLIGK